MNAIRQQLAYSRPGQREVNRTAYERGASMMGSARTPGQAGFGQRDVGRQIGRSNAPAAGGAQINPLLMLLALLQRR